MFRMAVKNERNKRITKAKINLASKFRKGRLVGRLTSEHETKFTDMDGEAYSNASQFAEIVALMQEL